MKNTFKHHIAPTFEEFEDLWKRAFVVFDTNVLLNLYRYSEKTATEILEMAETLKERVWLPYQVGWEYFNNRRHASIEQEQALVTLVQKILADIRKETGSSTRTKSSTVTSATEELIETLVNAEKRTMEILNAKKVALKDDQVLSRILALFNEQVGCKPDAKLLEESYKEGRRRYEEKIPPGYMDVAEKKNNTQRRLYGDFLIWKELLGHAKEKSLPIIFVTDDEKEDWFHIESGQKDGPRRELIEEMVETTGQMFWIYTSYGFLTHAAKHTNKPGPSSETLKEIDDQKKQPDDYYFDLELYNEVLGPLVEKTIRDFMVSPPASGAFTISGKPYVLSKGVGDVPFFGGPQGWQMPLFTVPHYQYWINERDIPQNADREQDRKKDESSPCLSGEVNKEQDEASVTIKKDDVPNQSPSLEETETSAIDPPKSDEE